MFQYLVSGLASGATIVLYDGSPLRPYSIMWDLIDRLGVTVFGASAKWIEAISKNYHDVSCSATIRVPSAHGEGERETYPQIPSSDPVHRIAATSTILRLCL